MRRSSGDVVAHMADMRKTGRKPQGGTVNEPGGVEESKGELWRWDCDVGGGGAGGDSDRRDGCGAGGDA